MEYILMHRTKEIARIELDEFSNIASIYEVYDHPGGEAHRMDCARFLL